jgi:uncharacterized protein (DUF305 family)
MTMNTRTTLFLAATFAVLAVPATAQMMDSNAMQKMMQMMTPAANDPASTKDFKQAHMNMMHNMHMQFSGNADADFAQSMVKHHEGGIEMAKIQLKHGKDPEMRKMAEKMIKEQGDDNKKLQAWLQKNQKK